MKKSYSGKIFEPLKLKKFYGNNFLSIFKKSKHYLTKSSLSFDDIHLQMVYLIMSQ